MRDTSSMEQFHHGLETSGYGSIQGKPAELGVYYKEESQFILVVLSVDYHVGFHLEPEQIPVIKQHVHKLFSDPQGDMPVPGIEKRRDIRFFTVYWCGHSEGMLELMRTDRECWAVDLEQKNLRIYEHQPDDFYGIRRQVEESLRNEVKQPAEIVKPRLSGRYPWGNLILVAVNVLVFVVLELMGDTNDAGFMLQHGAVYPESVLVHQEWYRMLTSMFLHFGITHIGNNMFMLFFLGANLERAMGHWKYLILYLVSGLGGGLLSLYRMFSTGDYAVVAGASGAIFGVIGALVYVVIRNRGRLEELTTGGLVFMAALSLYFGFTSSGVDNFAHVGGLITGFLAAVLLYRKRDAGATESDD